ncbi:MAG: hypothetical protein WAX44_03325 [Minisyncoccia bacterium]
MKYKTPKSFFVLFLLIVFVPIAFVHAYGTIYPGSVLNPLQIEIVPEPGARIDELQRQTQLQAIFLQQQKLQQQLLQQQLEARYPSNVRTNHPVTCQSGYVQKGDNCYTYDQSCNLSFPNSKYAGQNNSNGGLTCDCPSNYQWNSDRTSCIGKPQKVGVSPPAIVPKVQTQEIPNGNKSGNVACNKPVFSKMTYFGVMSEEECYTTWQNAVEARQKEQVKVVAPVIKKEVEVKENLSVKNDPEISNVVPPEDNLAATSSVPITQVQPKSLWSKIKSWFWF